MAFAGRIRCDFCSFVGEMVSAPLNNSQLKVPEMWISIHPTVVVHGMRGLKIDDPNYEKLSSIKDKVKTKVKSLHCCPACASDRNVFGLELALPAPPTQTVKDDVNPMRSVNA